MRSTFFILSILLVTSISFVACNDESKLENNPDRETGTLLLEVDWPAEHVFRSNSQSNALFDCAEMDVDKISAHVFSDTGEQLQTGGPWDCAARSGTIRNVPVGDNRIVRLCAFDPNGDEVYRGEVPDVSVQSQQAVSVNVFMENVFSRALSLVRDINPGTAGSFPHHLVTLQNQLCLVALDPNLGFELFNADSAQLLQDIYPTGVLDRTGVMAPSDFVELNGWLYFFANNGAGYRLWRTAGTAASTESVPASADYFNPTELTVLQDKIYFSADSVDAGRELWVLEESAGMVTATMFHDIRAGQASSNPHELTVAGEDLFFVANDGTLGYEIWRTNHQEEQCSIVADIYYEGSSNPRYLTNVNGRLFFVATDGSQTPPLTHGTEPWMIWRDEDTFTTQLVADINASSQHSGSSRARNLTWIQGSTLAFSAYTPDTGQELYLYDWQIDEAPRLYDLNPSGASSFPSNFVFLDGDFYFTAYNSQSVEHLWANPLDQSQPVQCLTTNMQNPAPRNLTAVNLTLYFTASHDSLGRRLWATDGTKTGLVVETAGGNSPHSPLNLFAASNDRLYYSAFDTDYGEELFQLVDR